jgi:hypothetical protein
MKSICLLAAACLVSGLVSTSAHAGTLTLTTEEEAEFNNLMSTMKNSIIAAQQKYLQEKSASEPKLNRASLSVGYMNARASGLKNSGKSASMSLSRTLPSKDTVYGFASGSLSNSYSAGNNFNGDSFGLGAGYSHVSEFGIILNGSLAITRSDTDGLISAGQTDITASRSLSGRMSIGVSKPFVINAQDVLTPSLSVSQSVTHHGKPTFRLSPRVKYSRKFSPKWSGDISVGGSGSHKNITLSGRKAYIDLGLGTRYKITDDVSAGLSYKRTESTGGHHGNNVTFSLSTMF